jgi:hypothetical protein
MQGLCQNQNFEIEYGVFDRNKFFGSMLILGNALIYWLAIAGQSHFYIML